jgi:DNA-binding winged helix-turn-helix (wHTH) protein
MLQLRDLAVRDDVRVGPLRISPSRRLVEGPAGKLNLEPLIMQVFLLLLDHDGRVVTRTELFDQCWGGAMVGDDSLNRAIGKVRRIADVAPGLFEIETIPRTGYRLTGNIVELLDEPLPEVSETDIEPPRYNRRSSLALGGAAVCAVVGGGLWYTFRGSSDRPFDALMARGDEAFRNGSAYDRPDHGGNPAMVALYEDAVRLQPRNAKAWGLLAYFRSCSLEFGSAQQSTRTIHDAEFAIRRALAIDPKEPNALTAMFLLQGPMLDWSARDRRLREILATEPANILATVELMPLLQAAGYTRESWNLNERILKIAPLSRPHLVVRAMKLWILGRVGDSDKVIDRVRGLWPLDEFAYSKRFMMFALTGRPRAAHAMLESAPKLIGPPDDVIVWRSALEALSTRSPQAIEAATSACLDAAKKAPWVVYNAIMILGALGQTDAAFEVLDGFLLWRGKAVSADQADPRVTNDYSRRMTQWLFTPPVAGIRADRRFLPLCEAFGRADYWRARGVRPDYQRYG